MQDIAQAVDLRKASLYHHVNSKQKILVDLLDQALDMLIESIEEVLAQDLPADEKFRMAMRSYLNCLAENLDLSSVLLLEHRSLEEKYRARHMPRRDRYEDLWRKIIEEGIEEGIFNQNDINLAGKVVLGVANWTVMWLDPKGRMDASQIADLSSEILLNGFYKRETI
jgi:AcrR family transcriptional regulator